MFNKFKAKFDFNVVLAGARLVVVEKGKRKAYNEDTKSKKDAETVPSFIRCRLIDDPSGINTDAELQIKVRNSSNVDIGQEIIISKGNTRLVGGQLGFWANKSTYRGKEWIFVNPSAKGDHFDDWN